ncbi:hypothetical protein ACIRVF_30345 [Kitasatospora sp. NPDC101157]|uniref:hypothetical protein n=1 Tax=Kitasatospora sp. NPDC101157 TaxID=3364098 RepID=UPI0038185D83
MPTSAQAATGTVRTGAGFCLVRDQDIQKNCVYRDPDRIYAHPTAGCYKAVATTPGSAVYIDNELNTTIRVHAGPDCKGGAIDSLPSGDMSFYLKRAFPDGVSFYVPQ